MGRRLDDTDLNNLEAAAHGRTSSGVIAHPLDIIRLVEEVRWYKANAVVLLNPDEFLQRGGMAPPHNDAHEQTPKYGPCPLRENYPLWKELQAVNGMFPVDPQSSPKNDDGDTPTVVKGN